MAELLLAHGYFLYEDPKELQIMKPYAPLGILYLCSHLRKQGFDVDVFDTTFSSREALFLHLRSEKPSVLGIYANLMTRKNVVEILKVAREAGWKTIVGGPEPGAYALEYLQAGADFVVDRRVIVKSQHRHERPQREALHNQRTQHDREGCQHDQVAIWEGGRAAGSVGQRERGGQSDDTAHPAPRHQQAVLDRRGSYLNACSEDAVH